MRLGVLGMWHRGVIWVDFNDIFFYTVNFLASLLMEAGLLNCTIYLCSGNVSFFIFFCLAVLLNVMLITTTMDISRVIGINWKLFGQSIEEAYLFFSGYKLYRQLLYPKKKGQIGNWQTARHLYALRTSI